MSIISPEEREELSKDLFESLDTAEFIHLRPNPKKEPMGHVRKWEEVARYTGRVTTKVFSREYAGRNTAAGYDYLMFSMPPYPEGTDLENMIRAQDRLRVSGTDIIYEVKGSDNGRTNGLSVQVDIVQVEGGVR